MIGKDSLDLIPQFFVNQFDLIAEITLLMVGFLLGGKLTRSSLKGHTGISFSISICATLLPALAVCPGMIAMGVTIEIAGASLELGALAAIGVIGGVYILCRALGKYPGAWVGGYLSQSGQDNQLWMGVALLPQAGVQSAMTRPDRVALR